MSGRWIDTHVHLDDPAFDADRAAVIATATESGVARCINIGFRPASWMPTVQLGKRYPHVSSALGVHPGSADEFSAAAMASLEQLIAIEKPVAIGEIGLDFYHSGPSAARQEDAFRQQLRLAVGAGLPVIIHQRAAESELMAVLRSESQLPPLILHSFDGSDRYGAFARELNCVVGIGGLATRKRSDALRHVLATIAPERLVLETDSPYLVPAGVKTQRNTPGFLPLIAERLAGLWSLDADRLAELTTRTAIATFGLS